MTWAFGTARTPWPLPPCLTIIADGATNTLAYVTTIFFCDI